MDEPRTHYQLSFTARQALLLFVVLIGALAVAYAFGLMTGLAGRGPEVAAAAVPGDSPAPGPSPAADSVDFPRAVRGIAPGRAPRTPSQDAFAAGGPTPVARIADAAPGSSPGRTILPAPAAGSTSSAGRAHGSSPERATSPSPGRPTSPSPGRLPSPSPGLQLFEDAPVSEPTLAAASAPNHPPGQPVAGRPAAKPSATPKPSAAFWVQALSASSESEAMQRRNRLISHGFHATVVPGPGPGGRVYRVRVGPFGTREEADRTAMQLRSKEKLQPWVVPPGK